MLTEWWDVPNVFQIVPSEEKAFNSKLLISQVIWRWLRIPKEYSWDTIHVKILNHTKFSENISHLVDEVLEKEEKLYSYPVKEKQDLCFPIYNLKYSEEQFSIEKEMIWEYSFEKLKKEWINLPADLAEESLKITYKSIWDLDHTTIEDYSIKRETIEIDILANDIFNRIKHWDTELETNYIEEYDFKSIKEILQKSLDKRWIKNITKEIATKCLQSFWTLKRFWNKNVRYELKPKSLDKLDILLLSTDKKNPFRIGRIFFNFFKIQEVILLI
jgi:type III restriction enzyme